MPKLPPDPYGHLRATAKVKLQSYVEETDKNLILTVCPKTEIYTLLINHALKRTVNFIKSNNLSYNDADFDRLVTFITRESDPVITAPVPTPTASGGLRKRTTPRSPGQSVPRDDAGGTAKAG